MSCNHNTSVGSDDRGCKDCRIAELEAKLDRLSNTPKFPVMLRKMWSGSEVQAWLDKYYKGSDPSRNAMIEAAQEKDDE